MSKIETVYPEVGAGGYSRANGTIQFYLRINALLRPEMRVLDYGAGRGAIFDSIDPFKKGLVRLQGKVAEMVGCDLDPVVRTRPYLDRAEVIEVGKPLPFPDGYFDLIYSDYVLEHVVDPQHVSAELHRVLKPGGWFCARTPNRWGIIGVVTRLVPNKLHVRALHSIGAVKPEHDAFPTAYKMNSMAQIRQWFPKARWANHSFLLNNEPPYVQHSLLAMRAMQFLWRFLPPYFATNLQIFVRKL